MFHLLAYSASYNSVAETDLTPITDPVFTIQNGHFLPNVDVQMLWATAMATNLQRARISTPTLLQLTTPFIRPIIGALIGADKAQVARFLRNPILLRAFEEIQVLVTDNAGVAQRVTVGLGVGQGIPGPTPGGPTYSLRGTGTTAMVANVWTQCPITWQNTLPNGQYVVTGMEFISANAQFGRLIFPNQVWRPGCLGMPTALAIPDMLFDTPNLGIWGTFNTTTIPLVEGLANAADAAQEVYLDCIRVG